MWIFVLAKLLHHFPITADYGAPVKAAQGSRQLTFQRLPGCASQEDTPPDRIHS